MLSYKEPYHVQQFSVFTTVIVKTMDNRHAKHSIIKLKRVKTVITNLLSTLHKDLGKKLDKPLTFYFW